MMEVLRGLPLQKAPGVAESLDWALALISLHRDHLDEAIVRQTLGCILKVREDHAVLDEHREAIGPVLSEAPALAPGGYSLATVTDRREVLRLAGLADAPVRAVGERPAESVVRVITNPALAGLLFMAGIGLIVAELLTSTFTGIGLAGAGLLGLFFWGHMLAGLAGWEGIILVALGLALLAAEVFQVGLAVAAADDVQVEVDIGRVPFVQGAEQVAAELLAGRATEPLTPPDIADAVNAGVAAAVDHRQLTQQIGPRAQLGLDRGHFIGRQGLVEVGLQIRLRDPWHARFRF